jgi:hypothetical protein
LPADVTQLDSSAADSADGAPPRKIVFVTQSVTGGNLGGLSGADARANRPQTASSRARSAHG